MPRRRRQSLTALALLALGWAQVFGLTRGWWCDCSGVVRVSQFDHCHGPHGAGGHHEEAPCHSQEDHDDEEGDTHEHVPARESLDAQTLTSLSVPCPPASSVEILADDALCRAAARQVRPAPRPPPLHGARRWPCLFAHTVALRI